RVEADGNVRLDIGEAFYSGQFKLRPKAISGAAEAPPRIAADGSVPVYRLDGTFTLDHRRLSVDEFRFETGPLENPYGADGMGLLDLGPEPRFSIAMDGAQVRFDEAV